MLLVVAFVVLFCATSFGEPVASWNLNVKSNRKLKVAMLDKHNNLRNSKSIARLKWDTRLADHALKWAQRCKFEHSHDSEYGENIAAWSTTTQQKAKMKEVKWQLLKHFKMYASESKNYNYQTNTCQPQKVCGHYTQLVWRNTTKVGCGIAQCPKDTALSGYSSFFSVCNYSPAYFSLKVQNCQSAVIANFVPPVSMGNSCCQPDDSDKCDQFDDVAVVQPYSLRSGIMAMQQNSLLAGISGLQAVSTFQEKIRLAKLEMKTISVQDGSLYIDYKFEGLIPPGARFSL